MSKLLFKPALVHLGLHKCGSTFIQKQLVDTNKDLFRVSYTKRKINNHLADMMFQDSMYDREKHISDLNLLYDENKENKPVIITEERLSGDSFCGLGSDCIAYELEKIFGKIKIAVILRNPIMYLNTLWASRRF